MSFEPAIFEKLAPDDTFLFQCSRCGECCHNVRNAVLVTSLDLFRIAQHRGQQVETIFELFTDVGMIDDVVKFPLLVLKAKQKGDACWFYREGRCSIQEVKPLTCKLYPMNIGPDDKGSFDYYLVSEKPHHYTGTVHRAGDWMDEFLTLDDRKFMLRWYVIAAKLGKISRQIIKISGGKIKQEKINVRIIWHMYLNFDINAGFWPQFERNIDCLFRELKNAAQGKPL